MELVQNVRACALQTVSISPRMPLSDVRYGGPPSAGRVGPSWGERGASMPNRGAAALFLAIPTGWRLWLVWGVMRNGSDTPWRCGESAKLLVVEVSRESSRVEPQRQRIAAIVRRSKQ